MNQSTQELKARAEKLRENADAAANSSEYPRLAKSANLSLAEALENLAAAQEAHESDAESGGNSYEDRKARRIARLHLKAARKKVESAEHFRRSHDIGSRIPFGQPILVGHHSEKGHRSAIKRMRSADEKSMEAHHAAQELEHRAKAAENSTAISSQDPVAVQKLRVKLAELERSQELMKAANRIVKRKKGTQEEKVVELEGLGFAHAAAVNLFVPNCFGSIGFEGWKLTNNSANMRRIRERIADLERRDEKEAKGPRADRLIGEIIVRENLEFHKIELHFPGKPDEETRAFLKSNGFRWIRSGGCWSRANDNATEARLKWLAEKIGAEITEAPEEVAA